MRTTSVRALAGSWYEHMCSKGAKEKRVADNLEVDPTLTDPVVAMFCNGVLNHRLMILDPWRAAVECVQREDALKLCGTSIMADIMKVVFRVEKAKWLFSRLDLPSQRALGIAGMTVDDVESDDFYVMLKRILEVKTLRVSYLRDIMGIVWVADRSEIANFPPKSDLRDILGLEPCEESCIVYVYERQSDSLSLELHVPTALDAVSHFLFMPVTNSNARCGRTARTSDQSAGLSEGVHRSGVFEIKAVERLV